MFEILEWAWLLLWVVMGISIARKFNGRIAPLALIMTMALAFAVGLQRIADNMPPMVPLLVAGALLGLLS